MTIERDKINILNELQFVSRKHRRSPDARWVMDTKYLQRIDEVISQIISDDPYILYKSLFFIDSFKMHESGDHDNEEKRIQRERADAVKAIIETEGIEGIVNLSSESPSPDILGYSLSLLDEEYCASILPDMMNSIGDEFLRGYAIGRFNKKGLDWGVFSHIDSWSPTKKVRFLYSLPFSSEIITYISNLTGEDAKFYWKNVKINQRTVENEYGMVVESLIKVGRINDSVQVLYSMLLREKGSGLKIDTGPIIKVLKSFVDWKEELVSMDAYHVLELIQRVQNDDSIPIQDKTDIEWTYLDLLNGLEGHRPITLENLLAQNSEFFCELIRLSYKSDKEESEYVSEERASKARYARMLLDVWNVLPGGDKINDFNAERFKEWFQVMRKNAEETGHLDFAMHHLGKILTKVPKDDDGFWINKEVAEILNEKNSDKLRNGLLSGFVNSTGTFTPGVGFEERMANEFHEKANAADKLGYRRLANCMRDTGDHYISMKREYSR